MFFNVALWSAIVQLVDMVLYEYIYHYYYYYYYYYYFVVF